MKKYLATLTLLPTLALAHESSTTSSVTHAIEHNLASPYFAIPTLLVLAVLIQVVRKAFAR